MAIDPCDLQSKYKFTRDEILDLSDASHAQYPESAYVMAEINLVASVNSNNCNDATTTLSRRHGESMSSRVRRFRFAVLLTDRLYLRCLGYVFGVVVVVFFFCSLVVASSVNKNAYKYVRSQGLTDCERRPQHGSICYLCLLCRFGGRTHFRAMCYWTEAQSSMRES